MNNTPKSHHRDELDLSINALDIRVVWTKRAEPRDHDTFLNEECTMFSPYGW